MTVNAEEKIEDMLLVAEDPHSKSALALAEKAAKSNATVLITGETGVGKELIARYIHEHSHYSKGPYISVNCAALPENMIEAILFGYEKGAFTSATQSYIGKFEQAHLGTLLLDEVAEIPVELQAKLLRVLQERQIERLGGKRMIPVDVRIIAATNRQLEEQVMAGYFRSDLYYRLNVVPVHCHPLRARPLDILPLTAYFLKKYAALLNRNVPVLTKAAQAKLMGYNWPGNVRELENVIHRTLILLSDDKIDDQDIPLNETLIGVESLDSAFQSTLKANEAKVILDVLSETDGSRELAAKKLNISPRTLRYKLSKLRSMGLKVPE